MRPLLAVVGLLLLGAAHAVPGAAGGKGAPSGELLEHGAGDAADSEVWPPFADLTWLLSAYMQAALYKCTPDHSASTPPPNRRAARGWKRTAQRHRCAARRRTRRVGASVLLPVAVRHS